MMNIAVFNGEAIKAIPVTRSLGRAAEGFKIVAFSLERLAPGGKSRYAFKNIFLKDYHVEKIKARLEEFKIDVIFPLEDASISFFLDHRPAFQAYKIIMPRREDFFLFYDKARTVEFCREHGISIPETFIPPSLQEGLAYLESRETFPLVIKPRRSTGSRGLKVVHSPPEALKQFQKINREYPLPLIQEYIPEGGRALGAEFLFYEGREILSFSHERIRQFPVKGGPSTYCKTYAGPLPLEIGRKIFQHIDYSGLAMAEFKEHPETKELYLMEVNPRPWGSISLPIFVRVDFPVEAVKVFYDPGGYKKKGEIPASSYEGHYMRWLLPADFLSILLDPRIKFTAKCRNLFKRYPRTVYQVIDKRDPLPALVLLLKVFLNCFNFKFIKKHLFRR